MLGRDLSRAAQVPPDYLSKIMLTIRNAGLVNAVRGAGGGYRLARAPEAINLIEVVKLFDPNYAKSICFLGLGECADTTDCPAHDRWNEICKKQMEFLQQTTLRDIAGAPSLHPEG